MLRSFVDRAELPDARMVVFSNSLRESDRALLRQCVGNRTVEFIDTRPQLRRLKGLPISHYTADAYTRIFAQEYFAENERLLFLDSDIVVNRSLSELASMSLEGRPLAAVPDTGKGQALHNGRLGRAPDAAFFNAGVLLIDVKAWREQGITDKALRWAHAHRAILEYADQDALNAAIDGNFAPLDATYNYGGFRTGGPRASEDLTTPRIIHFMGITKPNIAGCEHSAVPLFIQHRQNTPWRDAPLTTPEQRDRAVRRRRLTSAVQMYFAH